MARRLSHVSTQPSFLLILFVFSYLLPRCNASIADATSNSETLSNHLQTLPQLPRPPHPSPHHDRQSVSIPCPDLLPPVPFLPTQFPSPTSSDTLSTSRWTNSLTTLSTTASHVLVPSPNPASNSDRISNGRPADYALSSYLAFIVTPLSSLVPNQNQSSTVVTCTATLLTPTTVLTIAECVPTNDTVVYVGGVRGVSGEARTVRDWESVHADQNVVIVIHLTQPAPLWMRFMSSESNLMAPNVGESVRVAAYGTASVNSIEESILTYVDTVVQPLGYCETAFALNNVNNHSDAAIGNATHMCIQSSGCVACAGDLGGPVFLPDVAGVPLLYGMITSPLWPPNSTSRTCSQSVETQGVLMNVIRIASFIPNMDAKSRPTAQPTVSVSMTPMPSSSMMASRRPKKETHVAVFVGMGAAIVIAISSVFVACYLWCKSGHDNHRSSDATRARHIELSKDSPNAAASASMISVNASIKWPPEAARSDGTRSPAGIFASRSESLEETRRNLAIADWLRSSGSVSGGVEGSDSVSKPRDDRKWSRKSERCEAAAETATPRRHGQGQSMESRRRLVTEWLRSSAIARDARGNPSGSPPLGDA